MNDAYKAEQKRRNSAMRGMLHLVDFRKPIRDYVRRKLMESVLGSLENQPEPCGFALVVWDDRGCCTVSYDALNGPITTRMVPEHVKTAIQGQITASDTAWRYQLEGDER